MTTAKQQPAKSTAAAKKATPKKATPAKATPKRPATPENIKLAVQAARELRGTKGGSGPADHLAVRKVVTTALKGEEPTAASVAKVAGVSQAELKKIATGKAPSKPLAPFAATVREAGASKYAYTPKFTAAILVTYCDELSKAK